MNFETDYLANKVEDVELRNLLIKSRKVNTKGRATIHPVNYQGRTYWNIGQAIEEEKGRTSEETLKKIAIYFCISVIIYILGMYNAALVIMP